MITIIGEALDALGHSWHGHRIATAELRSRQEGPIPLTLDHNEIVGQVLTLTRVRGGAVHAIAVADDRCDPFLDIEEPIYFSPSISTRAADGTDGIVLELGLTLSTARVGAQPAVLKAGDIRKPNDRNRWRWSLHGVAAELVPRAAEEIRCRPEDAPIHIRDLEYEKQLERENRRASYLPVSPARSHTARGLLINPRERAGWKLGDVEWSRHAGRVISVR